MGEPRSTAFHAFSPRGLDLGLDLARALEGDLYVPRRLLDERKESVPAFGDASVPVHGFETVGGLMDSVFRRYAAHVFIGAAGIAVRAIAPHLRGKTVDPAVVVCEIHGRFVISLLSGHAGGANALARDLAERTGGAAVITTATDSEGLPALDVLADAAGCRVSEPATLKLVTAAMLAGRRPLLRDPGHILDLSDDERSRLFRETDDLPRSGDPATPAVTVGVRAVPPAPDLLRLFARRLHVGLGYRKNTPAAVLLDAVRSVLAEAGLAGEAVAALATADLKAADPAIREAARILKAPVRFFSAVDLAGTPVPHPSAKAREVLGTGPLSVSEGSALLSAGGGRLIIPKNVRAGVTVAVAMTESRKEALS